MVNSGILWKFVCIIDITPRWCAVNRTNGDSLCVMHTSNPSGTLDHPGKFVHAKHLSHVDVDMYCGWDMVHCPTHRGRTQPSFIPVRRRHFVCGNPTLATDDSSRGLLYGGKRSRKENIQIILTLTRDHVTIHTWSRLPAFPPPIWL